jgi:hypothetical protein
MYYRDIAANQKTRVATFQANSAFPSAKPIQESVPKRGMPDISQRRHTVEIDNVGRVKWHESINVRQQLAPSGSCPMVGLSGEFRLEGLGGGSAGTEAGRDGGERRDDEHGHRYDSE